jgi:ribosomal protein L11
MDINAASNILQSVITVPPAMQPQSSQQEIQAKQTAQHTAAAPQETTGDQISVNITVPRQTLETIEKISSVTDVLNTTAKNLRETGNSLKQSSDMMAQMKTELSKIVKNFPPFPPESAERRDILMSYQAIREQIDKMSIPPPPAPVYERVQSLWRELFPASKPNSVDTPALSQNATDTQVQQADEQLTFTRSAVTQLREAIGASLQD